MSRRFLDVRFLWVIGAIMCVFCTVGVAFMAAIVGLPLYLAVPLGLPYETAIQIFGYSALLWLPIGIGMGMVATSSIVRGIRRDEPKPPEQAN